MSCDQDCASSRMRLTLIPAYGTLSLSSGCARLDFDFAPVLRGDPGPPGAGSGGAPLISADADNRLIAGSDSGLYVRDDLTPDPLAYYLLAKG